MNNQEIDISIMVDDETESVYVKFSGFTDTEEASEYAEYLIDYLPLMLFDSDIKH